MLTAKKIMESLGQISEINVLDQVTSQDFAKADNALRLIDSGGVALFDLYGNRQHLLGIWKLNNNYYMKETQSPYASSTNVDKKSLREMIGMYFHTNYSYTEISPSDGKKFCISNKLFV